MGVVERGVGWTRPVGAAALHLLILLASPAASAFLRDYNFGGEIIREGTFELGKDWEAEKGDIAGQGCERPAKVAFARLAPLSARKMSFSAGELASYRCVPGYAVSGSSYSIRCVDGVWTEPKFSCALVRCAVPPAPESGRVSVPARPEFGSVAAYACADGFALDGPQLRQCTQDGIWSDVDPLCQAVRCPQPPFVENARLLSAPPAFSLGASVRYACLEGFRLLGDPSVTCLDSAAWSQPPTCVASSGAARCPPLPAIPGAVLMRSGGVDPLTGGYREGAFATLACRRGGAAQTLRCQRDGAGGGRLAWSTAELSCLGDCGNPGNPRHGRLEGGTSFSEGDSVTMSCDVGFRIRGERRVDTTCLSDGRWSPPLEDCEEVQCGEPLLENGTCFGPAFTYQAQVSCSCRVGFTPSGRTSTRVCQENGEWTAASPCAPVRCGAPPPLVNGRWFGDFTVGEVVAYDCNEGYELVGSRAGVVCQESGLWLGYPPICSPKTCPALEAPDHGFVENDESTVDTMVIFGCQKGYKLVGKPSILCQPSLSWSGPVPSCEMVTCGAVRVPHGRANSSGEAASPRGTVLVFGCDLGFTLVGPHYLECRDSGSWSDAAPRCQQVGCGAPPSVPNGKAAADRSDPRRVAFFCNEGFVLRGEPLVTCTEAGTWSGPAPSCTGLPSDECGPPPPIANAEPPAQPKPRYGVGATLRYRCSPGHAVTPDSSYSISCDARGEQAAAWSSPRLTCLPKVCSSPGEIENGYMAGSRFTFGGKVTYYCNKGYTISERHTTRECMADGMWSFGLPECRPATCEWPRARPGVVTERPSMPKFDNVITYGCEVGLRLVGPASRSCQADGTWSGEEPSCRVVACGEPAAIAGGRMVRDGDDPGVARVECDEGLVLEGPRARVCTPAGTWSGSEPACREPLREECGAPPAAANAEPVPEAGAGGAYEEGAVVRYRCRPGFAMSGLSIHAARCSVNHGRAAWSALRFNCSKVGCGAPPSVPNGEAVADRRDPRRVAFVCNEGLVLRGEPFVTCTEAGTWSGPAPSCTAPSRGVCGAPPDVPHAALPAGSLAVGDRFKAGAVLRYRCTPGHTVSPGSSYTIVCLAGDDSDRWSTPRLTCTPKSCGNPGEIENGYSMGSHFTFGSKVTYFCNKGYTISERHTTRECMADGMWSFALPECQRDAFTA